MSSTVMPTPDRRRPELLANLPGLRVRLEQHRDFLAEQLATAGPGGSEIDELLADANRRALGDIEIALHRMATGRYGTCLYCGAELPVGRLLAVPEADACTDCDRELPSARS